MGKLEESRIENFKKGDLLVRVGLVVYASQELLKDTWEFTGRPLYYAGKANGLIYFSTIPINQITKSEQLIGMLDRGPNNIQWSLYINPLTLVK